MSAAGIFKPGLSIGVLAACFWNSEAFIRLNALFVCFLEPIFDSDNPHLVSKPQILAAKTAHTRYIETAAHLSVITQDVLKNRLFP